MNLSNIKIITSRIGDALVIGFLFLAVFQLPEFVTYNGHDAGSQAAIEYWTLHGFLYGKDIIQNVGPLGFINYPRIYTGFLDVPKLLLNIFLTGSFILLLWKSSNSLPVAIRIVFLMLAGFFAVDDIMIYLLLLLVSHQLMFANRIKVVLFATLVLAFLSLAKGTGFFIAVVIITASVVGRVLFHRFFVAIYIAGSFVIFLLAFWMLTGQSIENLPAFAYAMASFSNGYNEAMTIFEPRRVQVTGFIALFGSLLIIFLRIVSFVRKNYTDAPAVGQQLLSSFVEFFILFVVWKHGFVRADGHVAIFFQYVLVSTLWILFRREHLNSSGSKALNISFGVLIPICVASNVACLVGIHSVYQLNPAVTFWKQFYKMDRLRLGISNIPAHLRNLDEELKKSIDKIQIPETRELAKSHSVGYFGILPAVMLYNNLNYEPSPSTISFASWNAVIMEANQTYFQDDKLAPTFLVYDLKTIDNRLAAQDDSLAQLEILHRYEAVGLEAGNIILKRIIGMGQISKSTISKKVYKVGSWIDVPQNSLNPTWIKVLVQENYLARIVAFAYKPPQYSIEMLLKNGIIKKYKFIPQMAATGFIVNPLIVENRDALIVRIQHEYQQYINDAHPNLSKVVRFKISCDEIKTLCGQHSTVTFEEIHGLALGNDSKLTNFYKLNSQRFDFDAELMDVQSANPIETRLAFNNIFYQFHEPSQITLHKPFGIQKLKAFYGMHPTAYEEGGATDGVEVSVRLVTVNGKDIMIFNKDLNPLVTPSDRGEQLLDINLPSSEGTLFIEISSKQSPAYDQFIIRNLSIQNLNN